MKKIVSYFFLCLITILLLSACNNMAEETTYSNFDSITASPSSNKAYAKVLAQSREKATFGNSSPYTGRGILWDLDGDGQEELIFYYQYAYCNIVFEVWGFRAGKAIQLSCVGDLPGIAGAGFPGVSLFQYCDTPYIGFWIENEESYPPGTKKMYDVSLWEIREDLLVPVPQLGITCLRTVSNIDRIISSHGVFFDENTDISEYSYLISLIFESPDELLLGGTLEEPLGTPLSLLEESLNHES